jgi:hypothetical protein
VKYSWLRLSSDPRRMRRGLARHIDKTTMSKADTQHATQTLAILMVACELRDLQGILRAIHGMPSCDVATSDSEAEGA